MRRRQLARIRSEDVKQTRFSQRSSGFSPACFAILASILGPISSESRNAKTKSGPTVSSKDLVRAGFLLDTPAESYQGREHPPSLSRFPLTHAARNETPVNSGVLSPSSRRSDRKSVV